MTSMIHGNPQKMLTSLLICFMSTGNSGAINTLMRLPQFHCHYCTIWSDQPIYQSNLAYIRPCQVTHLYPLDIGGYQPHRGDTTHRVRIYKQKYNANSFATCGWNIICNGHYIYLLGRVNLLSLAIKTCPPGTFVTL